MTMTRAQWLEARKKGLGGSDAAAVLGLNPWKTNVALWEEKTGRKEDEDISGKECVQYGVNCEPHMREIFKLDFPQYKVGHYDNVVIPHPEYPQLLASLDGHILDLKGRHGILEIKTTNVQSRADRQKWDNTVPENYYVQLLHYMLVTGAAFAVLKARLRNDWDGDIRITEKHYHYERSDHEEDIAYLLKKELAFWELVTTDTRPDLILPEL